MKKTLLVVIVVTSIAVGASSSSALLLLVRAPGRLSGASASIPNSEVLLKDEPSDFAAVQRELRELRQGREVDKERLAALLDIQTSLVRRVETSEQALAKMDDAQQALAALCDDYRLRIEMLSKDFQRIPESGRTSAFAESSRANSPTLSNDNPLFRHE